VKRVLVLCPTAREYRHLPPLAEALGCELVFDEFGGDYFDRFLGKNPDPGIAPLDIVALIDEIVARHSRSGLSGVTSGVGYPGMSAASVIGEKLGLPGPSPEAVMCCEHKYWSRCAQQQWVPEAVPEFHAIEPDDLADLADVTRFPVFLKPVKSCMSINAHRIDDARRLRELAGRALLPEGFVKPFNDLLRTYTSYPKHASSLLVESLLEGHQVSLEGYVYNREVHVMGILDALMVPGTLSFTRFEYPSSLPEVVRRRMADIAERFMIGIGYDGAPFNIEMFYDPRTDAIRIIEVNPKIASQFTELFTKVDGQSSYTVLLQLALGERPGFVRGAGEFAIAGSCVLRSFSDRHVVAVPAAEQIAAITAEYPDAQIEIHAVPGCNLSDQMQDSQTYRYALVNIGASSRQALEAKFADVASRLDFRFAPAETVAA
jgi:biotin carboxylase